MRVLLDEGRRVMTTTDENRLMRHADRELDLAGVGDPDADYDGALKQAVLDIVRVFSEQGHSGGSAAMVTAMVEKLLRFEPLTPLTGDEHEWNEVTDFDPGRGSRVWQNNRCSHVFREELDGETWAHDIESVVMIDPSGGAWSGGRHAARITFPYVPTREWVHIDVHGRALDGSGRDLPGFCDDDGCGCWHERSEQ